MVDLSRADRHSNALPRYSVKQGIGVTKSVIDNKPILLVERFPLGNAAARHPVDHAHRSSALGLHRLELHEPLAARDEDTALVGENDAARGAGRGRAGDDTRSREP